MKMQVLVLWWVAVSSVSLVEAAPFLEGTVQDEQGRPIEGVSVKIWDCIGTCLGGKTVLTDEDGRYIFEKKSFRNFPSLVISMPGRYEVSRQETGPKLHEPDTDTPRRVDFILGTPAAVTMRLEGDAPEGWTQKLILRPGRDVKLNRYDFQGRLVPGWGHWDFALLPRNESLHLVVIREPVLIESDDPDETRDRRRENWRNRVEIISPPLRLVDPQRYDVRAKMISDTENEKPSIILESINDATGADRTAELAVADSVFGPPVDEAAQKQALELLERVAASAVPWNAKPSKRIESYEYDFVDAKQKTTHVKIDQNSPVGPAWSDISRLHGFAYMPPLRWLFSQPENVVFHGVKTDQDRTVLHYRLKSGRRFTAGLGIGPSWNGFFSNYFSVGTLVIDTTNATVLEHRLAKSPLGEESIETFGDYVAVKQGYAPRSMRIQSDNLDFRLSFKIHKDRLWLLDEAFHGDQAQPTCQVKNVVVQLTE